MQKQSQSKAMYGMTHIERFNERKTFTRSSATENKQNCLYISDLQGQESDKPSPD